VKVFEPKRTRGRVALRSLITGFLIAGATAAAADDQSKPESDGKQLYVRYCGVCHGNDARGGTAISELIRVETPDLTEIALRRQGWYPEVLVREIIDGRWKIHGGRSMPIWGNVLTREQTIAITEHLFSLQKAFP
jgi:mono/diheme cytochrome c family protein